MCAARIGQIPARLAVEAAAAEVAPVPSVDAGEAVRQAIDRVRTCALVARIARHARRQMRPETQMPVAEDAEAEARREASAAEAALVRPRVLNSGDVYRWWVAALEQRYGAAYRPPTWTRAQQAKAKAIVREYGGELTSAVVAAVVAAAGSDLPTIDALHAARQRVFHAWQTRGRVPALLPWTGAKRGAAGAKGNGDVRDRRKNFDEFDWGNGSDNGGGHG